ncbi:lysylphosphatidylglycerol synthase transmembrane domain-containing protein [Cryptosporangium phraense]|uniref:Flippase-like domain-containing protein n=1 Tax=Cryptosporangium phraense TaxID=2593070 RepID=A0A545AVF2_9ACTN|nr:lysylphosphatidylglycerol synthase transmembrane domain-containing protein [Cryptosporangium phraense]TQS45306.1 flippase-like domain-containing protein [Cryptosporangium phraense]
MHRVPNRFRRWLRLMLVVVGVALAVVELRGHLPDAASAWAVLRQASPIWLAAALVLQVLSMAAFAEQQRHLLAGFGVRMSALVSLAVTYAHTAMSSALPAGSVVSAGYTFQQFCVRGASKSVAAAVMVLSGVASTAGLLVLYGGDALSWLSLGARMLAGVLAGALVLLVGWAYSRRPQRAGGPSTALPSSRAGRVVRAVRETTALARTVPPRRWLGVLALAIVNWLTDLACLLAALHAVDLTVPAHAVVAGYLAAQLVRQIPITPGGVGVIEASLILALTTAGAPLAPATAAVLIYRFLSCWMVLPVGLVCWTTQRNPRVQLAA